jgi:hypothetical protein
MSDRLEAAPSGRAGCRACGAKIEKGTSRFGEELPSAYGDGDATSLYWFHPRCAAHRRPEKLAALLRQDEAAAAALPDRDALLAEADLGIQYPKVARLAGAERASSGRALCRHCRVPIPKGDWRLRLSSFEGSGFFEPLGFVHAGCGPDYFELPDLAPLGTRLRQMSPEVDDAALEEIRTSPRPAPGADPATPD